MRIEKKVLVRHVLTEDYREKLLEKMDSDKQRLQTEIEQLRFQYQKQLKEQSDARNKSFIQTRFTAELNKRKQQLESINFKESKVKTLPEGSLVTGETVKTFTDVGVGDRWAAHRLEDEIIVEDGIVREIRAKGEKKDDDIQH